MTVGKNYVAQISRFSQARSGLQKDIRIRKQSRHFRQYMGPIKSQNVGTVRKPSAGGGFFQHTYQIHTKQLKDCASK